jgi:hypothetical protein
MAFTSAAVRDGGGEGGVVRMAEARPQTFTYRQRRTPCTLLGPRGMSRGPQPCLRARPRILAQRSFSGGEQQIESEEGEVG